MGGRRLLHQAGSPGLDLVQHLLHRLQRIGVRRLEDAIVAGVRVAGQRHFAIEPVAIAECFEQIIGGAKLPKTLLVVAELRRATVHRGGRRRCGGFAGGLPADAIGSADLLAIRGRRKTRRLDAARGPNRRAISAGQWPEPSCRRCSTAPALRALTVGSTHLRDSVGGPGRTAIVGRGPSRRIAAQRGQRIGGFWLRASLVGVDDGSIEIRQLLAVDGQEWHECQTGQHHQSAKRKAHGRVHRRPRLRLWWEKNERSGMILTDAERDNGIIAICKHGQTRETASELHHAV